MSKTAKNLSIVLGLVTVAFAGYYLYAQQSVSVLQFSSNDQTMQNMLNNTRVFIEHRRQLDSVTMDLSLLEDERFLSLRSYTTPIQERPIGRPDPFAPAATGDGVSF
tara:strand:- start:10188 stop:10508 length:321 start_codon:yes stop_codon:yes gene_type:complete